MRIRFAAVALGLAAAPAFATSLEDCERVMSQFQTEVARVPIASDEARQKAALLRGKFNRAVRAGGRADVPSALEGVDAFEKQAAAMGRRGELSRFDTDRMVNGARAATECLERVRRGR